MKVSHHIALVDGWDRASFSVFHSILFDFFLQHTQSRDGEHRGSKMQEQKQMAKALPHGAREADAFQTAIFDGNSEYQFHIGLSSFVSSSFLV